ncbi:hypothetical protein P7D73_20780 [Enterococcus raffinosus]|uniref:hypothetical protein n=1 Tax=Enterococcus TaxID=1350 RepID=UPI00288D9AF3|nr:MULTISPECIES: hypothetical protein [Enterococcus]MDT2482647.1 hypothetical protein [Enterococcus avium]MDT2509343.1 hypothetical protein [Enterococcus avium]MDT2525670.1 hypothetical protein [Enterococcus raffinosus]MDT2536205.1 hypothetical protein [Enterococcus raffinosus]MDT2579988.1 hypothetical protein [Enterococcus raffinosus]
MKKNLIKYWEVKGTVEKAYLIMSFIVLGVLIGAILFYSRLCVLHSLLNNTEYALVIGGFVVILILKRNLKMESETEDVSKN